MRRLLLPVAAVALLLAAVAGAVPLLLDSDAARRAIERQVSALAGIEVRYQSLALRLFPLPRAEFGGVSASDPGTLEASISSVEVRPAWLALLAGSFRPSAVRLVEPVIRVQLASAAAGDFFSLYRQAFDPLVAALTRDAPGMAFQVVRGRLDIGSGERRVVSLSELTAALDVKSDAIEATASSTADLWDRAEGRARISAGSLAATARVQVSGLREAIFRDRKVDADALEVRPLPLDSSIDIETDGHSTFRVASHATAPQFKLARGARVRDLGAMRAAWQVVIDRRMVSVTLQDFQVGGLLRGASGALRIPLDGSAAEFELKAAQLDIAQAHAAATELAVERGALAGPLGLVSAGTLRDVVLSGPWQEIVELTTSPAIRAEAAIDGAAVAVPAAGILVRNGSGRFLFADGVLRGSDLAGEIGNSSFGAGSLELDLHPATRLRALRADLVDALAITRHLSGSRPPAWIAAIEALEGRSAGSISYEARRTRSPLVVELANLSAKGRYRDVPFPLQVSRGGLRYSGDGVLVRGLAGSAGRSRFSDASIEVTIESEPAIKSASGEMALVFDEIFPWLHSLETLRPMLGQVQNVTGRARVRVARMSGPLLRPAALEFAATAEPEQVAIEAPSLHAPWTLASGAGEFDAHSMKLDRLAVMAGDSQVTVSGTIDDYAAVSRRLDLELSQGTLGEPTMDWIRARWQVPETAVPRAPIRIAAARVQWAGRENGPLAAHGRIRLADALDADFDFVWAPGDLHVKRLVVKDADSDATASLHWRPGTADLAFEGRFDRRSLPRMLVHSPSERGSVRGRFRGTIDLRDPRNSSGEGMLEGEGIDLNAFGIPVALERFSIQAAERVLQVHEGRIAVAGQEMQVSGRVEAREKFLALEARLSAKSLDATRLQHDLDAIEGPGERATGRPSLLRWDLPVSGRVAVAAGSLTLGRHVVQQFDGSVELAPGRIAVAATQARICGTAALFSAVFTPAGVEAMARLQARGQPVSDLLPCVGAEDLAVTGSYDLDAELAARGPADALLAATSGTYRFSARDGRLERPAVIGRALASEELASRLKTDTRSLMAEGLAYREFSVAGTLANGRARVDQGVIDSPRLGMTFNGEVSLADGALDLQGLIAPIDTGQRPGQGSSFTATPFGSSVVVVPVGIRGTADNPQVTVLTAAAVGGTLINLMAAKFLLPIQLLSISGARAPRD